MNNPNLKKLIWSLYSVVNVRGEVANLAIHAIKATLPYVEDPNMANALERTMTILDEQLVIADDKLWQILTHQKIYPTD